MAKGQQRKNREARKPKQDKKPAVAEVASGSQVRNAVGGFGSSKKSKS